MTAQQLFVLIFTFAIGLASGAYLYVTAYAPQFSPDQIGDATEIAFQVRAEAYGGCNRTDTCDAWLLDGRQYRLIDGTTGSTTDGVVEWRLIGKLRTALQDADPTALNLPGDRCASATDRLDYRYEVTIEGTTYQLDSCGTAFADSAEYDLLFQVWNTVYDRPVEYSNQGAAVILHTLIHNN